MGKWRLMKVDTWILIKSLIQIKTWSISVYLLIFPFQASSMFLERWDLAFMRFQSEEETLPKHSPPDESADRPTSSSLFTILENNFLRFVTHPKKIGRPNNQPPNDGLRRERWRWQKQLAPPSIAIWTHGQSTSQQSRHCCCTLQKSNLQDFHLSVEFFFSTWKRLEMEWRSN